MNFQLFDLELSASKNAPQEPFFAQMRLQDNGSLYLGSLFSKTPLLYVKPNKKGTELGDTQEFEIHRHFDSDAVGVVGGLKASLSGDTAFVVLHEGGAPSLLRGLLSKKWPELNPANLRPWLVEQDGGMGFSCRHSVGQIVDGQIQVRRLKEGGSLMDALHMGDFVFGLASGAIWREPYLEQRVEKRVHLRKDLLPNFHINRDAHDNFWFYGDKNRLYRAKINGVKAQPTFRTIEGPWSDSAASDEDGWLYGVSDGGHQVFRVRVNPVSMEDELQLIERFEGQVTGLAAVELKSSPFMIYAVSEGSHVSFYKTPLIKAEDPEFVPDVPKPEKIGEWEEVERVQDLALRKISESQYQIWGLAHGGEAGFAGKPFSLTTG